MHLNEFIINDLFYFKNKLYKSIVLFKRIEKLYTYDSYIVSLL